MLLKLSIIIFIIIITIIIVIDIKYTEVEQKLLVNSKTCYQIITTTAYLFLN